MKPITVFSTILMGCSFCVTVAQAADREFREVVRAISYEFHTAPLHLPFFGLVNAFTGAVHPGGAKHIDLAVFENLSARDLPAVVRRAVGDSWKPFVQVRSYRRGQEETVLVYLRQQGRDLKLLVTSMERDEVTVIEILLNPNALARWFASPEESARHWNRDDRE